MPARGTGKQRACLSCSLILTASDFKKSGCPNCPFLAMKSDGERVLQCTTGTFEGVVASVKPQESWVAKFSRIENFIPGAYALRMTGQLDQETQEALEEAGRYIRGRPEDD